MAKVYFRYSSMNAGKSTNLIQTSYNYIERGMHTLILKPAIDDREGGHAEIHSRIGISAECRIISNTDDLYKIVDAERLKYWKYEEDGIVSPLLAREMVTSKSKKGKLACVLVDEAQFLTPLQVEQLCAVADSQDIAVICAGLRTDSNGELFPGSEKLLAWADKIEEVKTICHCGSKATFVLRIAEDGTVIRGGEQVCIGGNDRYVSVCRRHFKAGICN
jgi:thymidine kinase